MPASAPRIFLGARMSLRSSLLSSGGNPTVAQSAYSHAVARLCRQSADSTSPKWAAMPARCPATRCRHRGTRSGCAIAAEGDPGGHGLLPTDGCRAAAGPTPHLRHHHLLAPDLGRHRGTQGFFRRMRARSSHIRVMAGKDREKPCRPWLAQLERSARPASVARRRESHCPPMSGFGALSKTPCPGSPFRHWELLLWHRLASGPDPRRLPVRPLRARCAVPWPGRSRRCRARPCARAVPPARALGSAAARRTAAAGTRRRSSP